MLSLNSQRAAVVRRIFILLFTLLFVLFVYTFLHEGGHAVAGVLAGGVLTAFNIDFIGLTAHAGIDGTFTAWQRALISLAGIGLPLVVWSVFLVARRQPPQENPVLDWLLFTGTVGVYSTLLAWIVLPILYLSGIEASDDSINFLRITQIHPLLLSFAALVVLLGGFRLYLYKVGGLRFARKRLNAALAAQDLPARAWKTLRSMGAILLTVIVATVFINLQLSPGSAAGIPVGYSEVFTISPEERGLQAEPVFRFNLEAQTTVNFYFTMDNFQAGPIQVVLSDLQGDRFTFMQIEDPHARIGHATLNPEPLLLEPGEYEILLTAPQGRSTLRGYLKIGS